MDTGLVAWTLVVSSMVLLMTPGLAMFYGGMARSKSVLNMMMMSFGAIAVVTVVYILWGYSMSYGGDDVAMLFANPFDMFGLSGIEATDESAGAGEYLTVAFQLTFAIITAALISGSIADRVRFSSWMVFVPIWVTLSYFPIAHQVWGGGFLSDAPGALADLIGGAAPVDYAGGTVVHINAGMAGLVLALVIGKRLGFPRTAMRPHNLTLTMLGAGLLWFGWYGFNVGSFVPPAEFPYGGYGDMASAFAGEGGLVWVNTTAATAAAMLCWLLVERLRDGKATSLGAASGVVAGLVAVTPACGSVSPVGALLLGGVAGALCALAVGLKYRVGYDDSLDVVGVHLVGGLVGTVGIGVLATDGGLLYGDGAASLWTQAVVAGYAMMWSGVATLVVAITIKYTMGWRIPDDDEVEGIDFTDHGEAAYDFSSSGGRRTTALAGSTATEVASA